MESKSLQTESHGHLVPWLICEHDDFPYQSVSHYQRCPTHSNMSLISVSAPSIHQNTTHKYIVVFRAGQPQVLFEVTWNGEVIYFSGWTGRDLLSSVWISMKKRSVTECEKNWSIGHCELCMILGEDFGGLAQQTAALCQVTLVWKCWWFIFPITIHVFLHVVGKENAINHPPNRHKSE